MEWTVLVLLLLRIIIGFVVLFFVISFSLGFIISRRTAQNHTKQRLLAESYVPSVTSIWKGKKFLVILNPYGGRRIARDILHDIMEPMFSKSDIYMEYIETKNVGHAKRIAQDTDLGNYCGIVIVSGDGMLSEVINGLANRTKSTADFYHLLQKVPIAIIPAGSSNGVATSLGSRDAFTAIKNIVEGNVRSVDICEVQMKDKTEWDCMQISWAVGGLHDELQEQKLRWMDTTLRNLLAPVISIVLKPSYKGKIQFMPAETKMKPGYADYRNLPEKDGWRIIEDQFFLISAINLSDVASDAKLAPNVQPCEGAVDLLVLRSKHSRWKFLKTFLCVEDGSHATLEWVEFYKAKQYILEPESTGAITMSGELLPAQRLHVKVHKGWLQMVTGEHKDE